MTSNDNLRKKFFETSLRWPAIAELSLDGRLRRKFPDFVQKLYYLFFFVLGFHNFLLGVQDHKESFLSQEKALRHFELISKLGSFFSAANYYKPTYLE